MQVNPVSSISYRVVRPKRASMGETESERRAHASPHKAKRTIVRNAFEIAIRHFARASAMTSFYAQLSAQEEFEGGSRHQRELSSRIAHANYRAAAVNKATPVTKFVV